MSAVSARRGQPPPRRLQIYYHPKVSGTEAFANQIVRYLNGRGLTPDAVSIEDAGAGSRVSDQDMIILIGGDGTILRGGRMAARHCLPALGVNFGRLGFLAEVQPQEWEGALTSILAGDYWLEERMMLHVEHHQEGHAQNACEVLNEAVVSRGALARPIRLRTWVDGNELTTYVADGLILATATGSTAYALAAGGPILPPELKNILIVPIAPHFSIERSIVLPHGATLKILVRTEHQAILSADGQIEVRLRDGDEITVCMSQFVTRFVRIQEPAYFYRNLNSRMTQNPSADKAK